MSVLKTLRQVVAPELNHLYTVPPFHGAGGLDCGWFCREHALHTFFVAQLFGADADIRTGDFAILSPDVPSVTSIGAGADHSWCCVSGAVPVDLSMTFAHFGRGPQLRSCVIGEGKNGDWLIKYAEDESAIGDHRDGMNEVFLIERKIESHTASDLLRNPYDFIHSPQEEDQSCWHVLYGSEIYAKITLHCFSVARRDAKALRSRFSASEAIKWISANYDGATDKIIGRLQ